MTRFLCVVSLLIGIVLVAGCRAKREVVTPETFPVSGKVVTNSPLPEGYQVILTPKDTEKTAFGTVQSDGSFSLTTLYMGVRCEGAAQDIYTVTVMPPVGLLNQGVSPYTLPQQLKIESARSDLSIPYPGR